MYNYNYKHIAIKLITKTLFLLTLLLVSIEIQAQKKSLIDSIHTEINSYRYQNALNLLDAQLDSISGIDSLKREYINLVLLKSQALKRSHRPEEAKEYYLLYIEAMDKANEGSDSSYVNQRNYQFAKEKVTE